VCVNSHQLFLPVPKASEKDADEDTLRRNSSHAGSLSQPGSCSSQTRCDAAPCKNEGNRLNNGAGSNTRVGLHVERGGVAPKTEPTPHKCSEADQVFTLGWKAFNKERFRAQGVLGSGGYGTVYLAVDEESGELVAVKRVPKVRKKSPADKVRRTLLKEASLLEEMQFSSQVVRLIDKFEDPCNIYLVLEYLEGGSLEDYVHRHRREMTEEDVACVARMVFEFLQDCHGAGVVFADVKPANFMLVGNTLASMKAIDFGCSQLQTRGEFLKLRTGTYKYFAPEVYRQRYGTEADNWSAGVMLFRIMTGCYPWWTPHKHVSPAEAMEEICSPDPVPFCQEKWAKWSPAARGFVEALLNKDPAGRMSAAAALQHPWLARDPAKAAPATRSNIFPLKTRGDRERLRHLQTCRVGIPAAV